LGFEGSEEVMSVERRPVEVRRRWAIVTIDEGANQCTVPAVNGGRFFVNGISERSIESAASYSRQFGTTYATAAEAYAEVES
jgi:hypothetical protein